MITIILNNLPYKKAKYDQWINTKLDEVVVISSKTTVGEFSNFGFKKIYSFERYEDNFDVENTVIKLHDLWGVKRIIALSESDIIRAGKLRSLLSIDGQDYFKANVFRDKVLMKQVANMSEIKIPAFARLYSIDAAKEFVEKNKFPVIIKPISGSGSVGVKVFYNESDFENYLRQNTDLFSGNYEIEKFIYGEMYHVDGIFDINKIAFSSVSKYYRGCLEFQDSMPLFSYILGKNSELKYKILRASEDLLKMMFQGIVSSFHLEVIVDSDENIFLCEVASRTGGSLIGQTIESKYGIFLNEYSVKRQMGYCIDYTVSDISDEFGFIIVPPKKGRISQVVHQEKILSYFDYFENNIVVGAKYKKGIDSVDCILSGILKAKNENDLISKFEQLSKMIDESLIYEEEGL